ncbi:glycyl-tRNA synthetase / glycine--tRNA ligase [Artemisia annua]|uniref:Glycyl-tRNA synthetase / glycine--tRNA ligase n=1 Tax=Artemisia annua TaxID=35608 RepID=A0A2U1N2R1_ARTAN|nr:glycyl-tRNA synthetase / glycine--tRNA ligase [Artemisia annua]
MQQVYFHEDNRTWSIYPEKAEGTFTNLENLYRLNEITKLPYAAAQLTEKALICENSPRHCLLNVDVSTIGEIEHFMDSQDSSHPNSKEIANNQTLAFFIGRVYLFLKHLGIDENRLQFRQLPLKEMPPYAADCWKAVITPNKVELFRAFRDHHKMVRRALKALDYKKAVKMKYILEQKGQVKFKVGTLQQTVSLTKNMVSVSTETLTPSLIKLSLCIGRIISCLYEHSFYLGRDNENQQLCVFRFTPPVAPIKCAISIMDPKYEQLAVSISQKLEAAGVVNELDISGKPMGHVRTDELGVPLAVVVDSATSVMIRERDSNEEIQLAMEDAVAAVKDLTNGCYTWGAFMDRRRLYEV